MHTNDQRPGIQRPADQIPARWDIAKSILPVARGFALHEAAWWSDAEI